MANNTKQLEVFTIWSDEIENRLDPFFYLKSKYKFDGKFLDEFVDKISSGKNISRDKFIDDGVPYLRVQNLKPYEIEIGELFLPVDAPYPKTTSDTFLTGRVGSLGVFVKANDVYFYSDNILAISFKKSPKIDLDYLEAVLNSPIISEQVTRLSKGNNQKLVSQETIKRIKIPVPPLSVQKEMVEKIQAAYEQKRKKEEEIKKILASIDDFVLGELGIEIPEGGAEQVYEIWSDEILGGRLDPFFYKPLFRSLLKQIKKQRFVTLGEAITDLSGGATPKISGDYYLENDGIPFLRVQNITEEGIKLDDVKYIKQEVHEKQLKRSQLKAGDVIFTITGRIGSVAVVPENFEGNINQHSVRFHLKDEIKGMKILPEYLAAFFNTQIGRDLSFRYTTGGTRPALDYEALRDLVLPLPSIEKQKKIIDGVKNLHAKIRSLRAQATEVLASAQKQVEQMILA